MSNLPGPGNLAYGCASADAGCAVPNGGDLGDVISLQCSAQANCAPGTICCVSLTQAGALSSRCAATCVSNGGVDRAQLCDPNAPDGGGCPQANPCSSDNIGDWGLPNTYATCGGRGN